MTYVRNAEGHRLPCCWDDCQRPGHDEIRLVEAKNGQNAIYVFCSESHRQLHRNSHIQYGRLPLGERGLIH